jgi:branched-chain amino acid transport system ATP-binding protein
LLDEIAGGLSERETADLMHLTRELQRRGMTILLIEHVMTLMTEGVDRLLVIAEGHRLKCGLPAEVMRSADVMACYLGTDET